MQINQFGLSLYGSQSLMLAGICHSYLTADGLNSIDTVGEFLQKSPDEALASEAISDYGLDTPDDGTPSHMELNGYCASALAGAFAEFRSARPDVMALEPDDLDFEDLDPTLAQDISSDGSSPESWSLHEVRLHDGAWHIAYHSDLRRGGAVWTGNGSAGLTAWTDAESAVDVLRRVIAMEVID